MNSDSFHEKEEAALNDEPEKAETMKEYERISDCLSELLNIDRAVEKEEYKEMFTSLLERDEE